MKMTFLELRREPGRLLDALERREEVTLSRRGREIARVVPLEGASSIDVERHPAFGMWSARKDLKDPVRAVRRMRRGRSHGL